MPVIDRQKSFVPSAQREMWDKTFLRNYSQESWLRSQLGRSGFILMLTALCCFVYMAVGIAAGSRPLHAQADDTSPEDPIEILDGYEYTVQPGETWRVIATYTGLTVSELQTANPTPTQRGYLREGERLTVPVRIATTTHVVQRGDSWSMVAQEYGISQSMLRAFNPIASQYGEVMRLNDTLTIPLPNEAVGPAPTATPEGLSATVAEAATTAPITDTTTATTTATTTDTTTATDEIANAPAATDVPTSTLAAPTATLMPACPTTIDRYLAQLVDLLNRSAGDVELLSTFLMDCGVMDQGSVATQDFTGDGVDDFVIVYADPNSESTTPSMDLLIVDSGTAASGGYQIGHQARAESQVQLLSTVDINADGQLDVVWTETTCGADDCFQTVQIYSWSGTSWLDWTAAKVIMANAELQLEDVDDTGSGFELVLDGGLYQGDAAGPQRSRHVVWGSIAGQPYTVLTEEVAESDCLYHWVLDGNAAFLNGATDEFTAAELFYSPAVANNALTACGDRPNEIAELRSFSIFRLALLAAYRGQPTIATDLIVGLGGSFPESVYNQVGLTWLAGYQTNYDIADGCAAVLAFAEATPEAVAILADYGYANPTFTAEDICPVLDIDVPLIQRPATATTVAEETVAETAAAETAAEANSETPAENTTNDANAAASGSEANGNEANNAAALPIDSAEVAETPAITGTAALEAATDGLPDCPENLAGYTTALATLLDVAAGDTLIIESWLRLCDAMSDEEQVYQLVDLNNDRRQDAIFLPTIISDRGFGPGGAQGAVLIYHGTAENGYELAANPLIYGKPALLAIGDLNADGKTDIAWTVEGCGLFCVAEVEVVSWQNAVYTSTIAAGATIAEGTATFTTVDAGTMGKGKQLVLVGGVSGTKDGGLAVPHSEIWQSINQAPFQRVAWTYDRRVEGSDCMGLRLVEANVALQASPYIGYEAAIDLYTNSIDPALAACSLYGLAADDELQLLQGLATFRLIQTQALADHLETADEILAGLTRGLPDSDYTQASTDWLASYRENADAAAACAAVAEIFEENTELWQITDNYGYNHPALAAEDICYVPEKLR